MVKKISTEELKKKLDNREKFLLVDVLLQQSYDLQHIPGSISVPYDADFLERFVKVPGAAKDAEIITYCASSGCQLSAIAAHVLMEAGYTNVGHYVDGLVGWNDAGYEFEGEEKAG